MTDQEQELLKRVLNSRQFASAGSLRRILEYLCDQTVDRQQSSVKEYDIATQALGRPSSFDPKTDPIVRVNIATIRERLTTFFRQEARGSAVRLHIPKGQYRVVFEEADSRANALPPVQQRFPDVERFWQPYLTGRYPNTLVFTELLFFRDDHGTYLRNIFVNDLATGLEQLRERIPYADSQAFQPSFHFVSAGEVHCLLSLTRMFERLGVQCATRNSRFLAWNLLRESNLILIGSSRTNVFIDSFQGENVFVLGPDRIVNLAPQAGEDEVYQGFRTQDGKLEKTTEYALITRRPGVTSDCFVTSISANHGRAIEGAGDFVTNPNQMRLLVQRLDPENRGEFPNHFQALLRVEMVDFDEEVTQVDIIATRTIA
jgi:hypothetical protein